MTTTPPDDHRRRKRRRYNWPRLKAEYVEGITDEQGRVHWPSFSEVAQRNGVHSQSLRTRAAQEKWTDDRARFQARIEAQRQNERATELASLGADFDVNALRVARNGMTITAARLGELGMQAQLRAEALQQNRGRETAGTPPPIDSEELGQLSRAATTWYDLGTKALGEVPTQRVELDLSGDVHVEASLSDDERAVRLLSILTEAGVLPDVGHDDVLDVDGGPARALASGADPEDEPLYPGDVDDGSEREPQATGVPATRSA